MVGVVCVWCECAYILDSVYLKKPSTLESQQQLPFAPVEGASGFKAVTEEVTESHSSDPFVRRTPPLVSGES